MSDEDKPKPKPNSSAKAKGAKGKAAKGKGKGKKGGAQQISVAGHPRARAQVRAAKGWGGLAGFLIAGYLSLSANVPADQAALRAIGAGMVGYVVAWGCAVTIWRQLVIAELRAAAEHALAQRPRAAEAETSEAG